jgi:hypothetical protein
MGWGEGEPSRIQTEVHGEDWPHSRTWQSRMVLDSAIASWSAASPLPLFPYATFTFSF